MFIVTDLVSLNRENISDNAALTHLRIRLGTTAVTVFEIAYKTTATTKLHVTLHDRLFREGSQKRSDYFQYIKKFAARS